MVRLFLWRTRISFCFTATGLSSHLPLVRMRRSKRSAKKRPRLAKLMRKTRNQRRVSVQRNKNELKSKYVDNKIYDQKERNKKVKQRKQPIERTKSP